MKRRTVIRPTTEQKYFNYLSYIYSKTQKPKIFKASQLATQFCMTPAALIVLKDLGILEYEKDKSNRRLTMYKWAAEKPTRKMAIEVIKNVNAKHRGVKNKNVFIPFETDFSKGVENSNANPIFCKQIKNGEVEVKPIKSKKTQPVKKEEKTAVNISFFWGLFKITLKK